MSPATDRVLAEGLTCSKTIIRVPSSGALRAYFTGRRVGRRGKSFNDGCVDCCDEVHLVHCRRARHQLPDSRQSAETIVIDLTRWTPPDISTVGDVHFGKLVKYGHRLFTNVANEIGPAVSEQSVTEPPHFGRT